MKKLQNLSDIFQRGTGNPGWRDRDKVRRIVAKNEGSRAALAEAGLTAPDADDGATGDDGVTVSRAEVLHRVAVEADATGKSPQLTLAQLLLDEKEGEQVKELFWPEVVRLVKAKTEQMTEAEQRALVVHLALDTYSFERMTEGGAR